MEENPEKAEPGALFLNLIRRHLAYGLSLPERAVRSLAALVGGTTSLLTETLLPEALRNTTSYRISVGLLQQFMIERVAGIENETATDQAAQQQNYVQRKVAGTALEAAGLLAMRFSPLWVFAIASDVAGGGKLFLNRLVTRLKENEVIDQTVEVTDLVDVLDVLQTAADKSATAIDTPPLSREELIQVADELRASYSQVFTNTTTLLPDLDTMWARMEQLADRDNVSIEHLSGVMTFDAAQLGRKGLSTAQATGQMSLDLLNETIFASYRQTLTAVSEQGADVYIGVHLQPFLAAAKAHFDPEQKTWTEKLFDNKPK